VALADGKVVGIVRGCDFHCTGSERPIDETVGHDGERTADDRQAQRLPNQAPVSIVVGMHRDRRVSEHGLRTSGGHHDATATLGLWISDLVELAHRLCMLDLEIR
jgi:hypothetical protein